MTSYCRAGACSHHRSFRTVGDACPYSENNFVSSHINDLKKSLLCSAREVASSVSEKTVGSFCYSAGASPRLTIKADRKITTQKFFACFFTKKYGACFIYEEKAERLTSTLQATQLKSFLPTFLQKSMVTRFPRNELYKSDGRRDARYWTRD